MKLNELQRPKNAVSKRKIVGRGQGSGQGKTAGKGSKGQKSRSGYSRSPWFEGGQMPLIRRVPKRGFRNIFKKEFVPVNLYKFDDFENGCEITPEMLYKKGIINKKDLKVKILGEGDLHKNLFIKAHAFSTEARNKIEKAGGRVELL